MGKNKDVFKASNAEYQKYLDEDSVKLSEKKNPKLVWVTFDPLLETILCVHDAPDCVCDACKPTHEERLRENCIYQLEERRFVIMEYDDNDLEEV